MAVVVTILAFALLVIIHEGGHFLVARACGMRVDRFSIGFGPVLWSRKRGDTEWAVSALPLGGYVKIAGMAPGEEIAPGDEKAYLNQPAWRRFLVILAGPAMNYAAAIVLAVGLISTFGFHEPDPTTTVGEVSENSAAAKAGLQPGDLIEAADGQAIDGWPALVAAVQAHADRDMRLTVKRGRSELTLTAHIGSVDGRPQLGVGQHTIVEKASFGEAMSAGVLQTDRKISEIVSELASMVSLKSKPQLAGPIGIAQEMAKGARMGPAAFLARVWVISIMLALFNVLPLPALDGGRLAFLLYELVTRRRVNQRMENLVHLAGMLALLGLMVAVSVFGDLPKLFKH